MMTAKPLVLMAARMTRLADSAARRPSVCLSADLVSCLVRKTGDQIVGRAADFWRANFGVGLCFAAWAESVVLKMSSAHGTSLFSQFLSSASIASSWVVSMTDVSSCTEFVPSHVS